MMVSSDLSAQRGTRTFMASSAKCFQEPCTFRGRSKYMCLEHSIRFHLGTLLIARLFHLPERLESRLALQSGEAAKSGVDGTHCSRILEQCHLGSLFGFSLE